MLPRTALFVFATCLSTSTRALAGTFYVDAALASGANDGSTWLNAFQGTGGLQLALAAAGPGDQVWVADGTYLPTAGASRTVSFGLESGVAIYGGFASGETLLSQRDPATNVAVLSGDLAGDDGVGSFTENSFHVVRGNGANATAVLDGFTVTGGNANGSSATDDDRGGGFLLVAGEQATIVDCRVQANRCTFGGGAGYIRMSGSTFTRCRFLNNLGGSFGGAFDMANSVTAEFRRCTFTGNSAARAGGIEIFGGSTTKVYDCLFTGNTSTGSGGGGAMFISGSPAVVRGCTVTGNTSNVNATAGILVSSGGGPTVANSILYFNSGPGGAQGSSNQTAGGAAVSYSCVQGGVAGAGNISGNPVFTNAGAGDYTLAGGTPCADAGNNSAVPVVSLLDLGGEIRIADDPSTVDTGLGDRPIVDMGAFERPNALYETFCYGDGSLPTPCPCGNNAGAGHGCLNSDLFSAGGITWAGGTSSPDTVVLGGRDMLPTVTCIFLQGNLSISAGVAFGDGLRCVGGALKRMYVKSTDANGEVSAPGLGDLSITARSAMAGDPISSPSVRYYQIWYRDSSPGYCPRPIGNTWNASAGTVVHW